jgi:Predicted dehydrogenases and related proteins
MLANQNAFNKQNIPLFVAYYRRSLPRFNTIKTWLFEQKIGEVRHITWLLNKPANSLDNSKTYNWRTDKNIAYGGYFDDLASHGIDLFIYLLGNITAANGIATNQQGLYTAMDAVTGNWLHKSGVTGSGSWNFGAQKKEILLQFMVTKGNFIFCI